MPRFTFASGNLRKIAALPLYGLGRIASALVRRRDRLWVFGSGTGVGEGALALLEHVRRVDPSIRVVWLARDRRDLADARAHGIRAAPKDGWRGFRLTLRARVAVVTHGFGDVNRYATHGAFVVQLWHGIPFKRVHIDSPEAMRVPVLGRLAPVRRAVQRAYAASGRGIGVFAAASARSGRRLQSGFALRDDQLAITGDPRDDALLPGPVHRDAASVSAAAVRRLAGLLGDDRIGRSRLLLYAPTWRDGGHDPSIPDPEEWRAIARRLDAADELLIVRSHPLGSGDYAAAAAATDRVLFLPATLAGDVTPLLPAIDVLITDYSSIAFDFALLGRPILYLAPDAAPYSRRRGVYEPYAAFSGGLEATDWAELLARLTELDDEAGLRRVIAHVERIARRFHAWHDGGNTARVYDEIRARLAGSGPLHPIAAAEERQAEADTAAAPVIIDEVRVETADPAAPELHVAGVVVGGIGAAHARSGSAVPAAVELRGSRARLRAEVAHGDDGRWSARLALTRAPWGGRPLALPSDDYRLTIVDDAGNDLEAARVDTVLTERLVPGAFRIAVDGGDVPLVRLSPPLADDETGAANQRRLEAEYRRADAPLRDAVFFESFYGRNASCNPRGIDRALARLRPDTVRYWATADASVPIPEGAVRVVEGSAAWWDARAHARMLIVNDWLRKRYRARHGQSVLQTWHGTPLKRIAMTRRGLRPRARLAAFREQARWDLMLAQNPFSADVFRSAYAFRGPIWQEGYPRNDVLRDGDADAVRDRLGIPRDARVVLYAPTWRDDRPGDVDHLDVARFAAELGPGHVTLIRGHSRTLAPGADIVSENVVDVTGFPEVSELFLAADLLVTDYSSVMFDFTVTGKPIFFFVPDFADYRDRLRGFTFDLRPVAPGPMVHDLETLVAEIREIDQVVARFADRYAAWRHRFNPRDDGHAGDRVVRRLIDERRL